MLTREQILKKRTLKYEDVECEGMGGVVRVRAMTASEKDLFEQRYAKLMSGKDIIRNLRATLLVHCIVDVDGKLLFSMDDVEALGEQDGLEIDKLFSVAQDLSGFTAEDEETLKKQ